MRMRLLIGAACLLASTVPAAGCGGSAEARAAGAAGAAGAPSSPAWPDPLPQDQWAQAYAAVLCGRAAQCCTDLGLVPDVHSDCEASWRLEAQWWLEDMLGHKVTYDAHMASECLSWIDKLLAICTTYGDEMWSAAVRACDGMWVGATPEFKSCDVDAECAGFAAGASRCSEGVCRKVRRAAKGAECAESCTGQGFFCQKTGSNQAEGQCWQEDGLYCDETDACAESLAVGQPCFEELSCVTTARCDLALGCVPLPGPGEDCVAEVHSGGCRPGAWCDASTGTCAAMLELGSACSERYQCASLRCEFGRCVTDAATMVAGECG